MRHRWLVQRSSGAGARMVAVDLEDELEPIEGSADRPRVFVLCRFGGQIVGHVVLVAERRLGPEEQWTAITRALGPALERTALRQRLERTLGACPLPGELSISVVVCTRDRPADLDRCLASLTKLDPRPAEILVVDNAPTDDAARRICADRPEVTYLREDAPGQTRARNRAVSVARGDIVAFTDDDCEADPGWLAPMRHAFADPLTMAFCGQVTPAVLHTEAQFLFEAHGGFQRHSEPRVFDPAKVSPVIAAASVGAGANFAVRREVVACVGGFAEYLGPGSPARSSDDKEMLYRILAAGYRARYHPGSVVRHHHRADEPGLRRIMRDYGTSEFAYTLDLLLRRGELDVVRLWRWWLRHYATDIRKHRARHPDAVPTWIPAEEIRGVLAGPAALVRSLRERNRRAPRVELREDDATPPSVDVVGEHPRLSVTIATYNRRDSLLTTLDALARQDFPKDAFDVTVVVDGSIDGTAEAARAFSAPMEVFVVEQPNRGLAAARNAGAYAAENPVVLFLDDDIRPQAGFLRAHAAEHTAQSGARFVLGSYPPRPLHLGDDLWTQTVHAWWVDHFRRKALPAHRWSFVDFVDGNLSVPRDLFFHLGGLDETFTGGRRQDWELGQRILESGTQFSYAPGAMGWHDFDAKLSTAVRNIREEGRYDLRLIRKHPVLAPRLPIVRLVAAGAGAKALRLPTHDLSRRTILSAVRMLERCRAREKWRRAVGVLLLSAYAEGLETEAKDEAELTRIAEGIRQRVGMHSETVDLLQPEPLAARQADWTLLSMVLDGKPIGSTLAPNPGDQWDAEDVIERLVDSSAGGAGLSSLLAPEGAP